MQPTIKELKDDQSSNLGSSIVGFGIVPSINPNFRLALSALTSSVDHSLYLSPVNITDVINAPGLSDANREYGVGMLTAPP